MSDLQMHAAAGMTGVAAAPALSPVGTDIRVRRLPDGELVGARQIELRGRLMLIEMSGPDAPLGTLVEIQTESTFYWGEVQRQDGAQLVLHLEGSLSRAAISAITNGWD